MMTALGHLPTQTNDVNGLSWYVCVGVQIENGSSLARLAGARSGPTNPVRAGFFSCFKFKANENRRELN
jgi:hypothetical protein